jgi:hypothetical protein
MYYYLHSPQVESGATLTVNNSSEDLNKHHPHKRDITSKLAPGTEGTMTMVGGLQSLAEPLVAFVRLAHAVVMPSLMEIQVVSAILVVTRNLSKNDPKRPKRPKLSPT